MSSSPQQLLLAKKSHAKYFARLLNLMPGEFAEYDSSRLTFAFFSIAGLDLLDALDVMSTEERNRAIDWIYSLEVISDDRRDGFQPSTMLPNSLGGGYRRGHLAMTYVALATLLCLGDDFKRLEGRRRSLALGVRACQTADGSFSAMIDNSENDMRFLYCACCISSMIDDWSGVDKAAAVRYIVRSISYDGGIGQGPDLESHGGSTFCAVASLALMNELDNVFFEDRLEALRRWCLMRQKDTYQGRPGKASDTCYSFWIGATLRLLGVSGLADPRPNRDFVLGMQDPIYGGIGKMPDAVSDPLHTYLGLAGLSLLDEPGLLSMDAALNISKRAYARMKEIHERWRRQ